jgi:hypothetical protein
MTPPAYTGWLLLLLLPGQQVPRIHHLLLHVSPRRRVRHAAVRGGVPGQRPETAGSAHTAADSARAAGHPRRSSGVVGVQGRAEVPSGRAEAAPEVGVVRRVGRVGEGLLLLRRLLLLLLPGRRLEVAPRELRVPVRRREPSVLLLLLLLLQVQLLR